MPRTTNVTIDQCGSLYEAECPHSSDQVRERGLPLLRDAQSLLPPLEEMEKNITGFYQALEKASHITSSTDSEGPVDFKQKCQVTIVYLCFLLKYLISRCA